MSIPQTFIGIDISKAFLDTFDDSTGQLGRVANTDSDIAAFLNGLAPGTTVVFEATGAYDRKLRLALERAGITYIRVNPNRADNKCRDDTVA
jgi:transposase